MPQTKRLGWSSFPQRKRISPSRCRSALVMECLENRCLMASGFFQVNLASDVPGLARVIDPSLVNPWGLSASPTGPFWIAERGAGISDVLDGRADAIPLSAEIPTAKGFGAGTP